MLLLSPGGCAGGSCAGGSCAGGGRHVVVQAGGVELADVPGLPRVGLTPTAYIFITHLPVIYLPAGK